ncbi:MAG: baseplate J/gp47 family protein [Chloroflexota bacterium]|nr:baseplate J/gp47 family protein [Chloroflexota bacterium]
MTSHEPDDSARESEPSDTRPGTTDGGSLLDRWAASARDLPGRLRDEWRQFVADWRASRRGEAAAPPRTRRRRRPRNVPRSVPYMAGAATVVARREDDANSIIGRIDTASEVEVLLVVPRRARGLREAMAWPRIAAYARQRGLTVHVLASRRDVRQHALNAGLRAARTSTGLRDMPTLRIPLGPRELTLRPPPLTPLLRLAAFAAIPVLAFGAIAYYVPSADIFIAPPGEPLTTSVRAHISPVGETNIAEGVVGATSVSETIVAVASTVTTGTASVGDVPATVELEFTNSGAADVRLPVGTAVEDPDEFTFTTDEAVTVPAGETAYIGATAIQPGTVGNVEASTLRFMIGFPTTLAVTNPVAAEGGADIEVPAAAADDRVRVSGIAEDVLRRAGTRALERIIEDGTVFQESVTVAILSQEPLVEIGEPAETFLMEYTAIVSAVVLPDAAAERAAEQILVSVLPDGMALIPGSAEMVADDPTFDGSRLVATLTATGLTTELFDPTTLRGLLTGVAPATAAERLRTQLELDVEPLIRVHPTWLPAVRMPQREDRISVVFLSEEDLAAEIAGLPDDEEDTEGEDTGDE